MSRRSLFQAMSKKPSTLRIK